MEKIYQLIPEKGWIATKIERAEHFSSRWGLWKETCLLSGVILNFIDCGTLKSTKLNKIFPNYDPLIEENGSLSYSHTDKLPRNSKDCPKWGTLSQRKKWYQGRSVWKVNCSPTKNTTTQCLIKSSNWVQNKLALFELFQLGLIHELFRGTRYPEK